MKEYRLTDWLPTTKKEVELRGWDELDVILFSGDAYVDHPSFGAAVIGRILEAEGLKVAIIPSPTGVMTCVTSESWVVPDYSSASLPEVWTRWLTNTLPTSVCAVRMRTLRTAVRICVRSILPSYTVRF